MKKIKNPHRQDWAKLCRRPTEPADNLDRLVREVFEAVSVQGDDAVRSYVRQFEKRDATALRVSPEEIANAAEQVPLPLRKAITMAAGNISRFHRSQREDVRYVQTASGVCCWRESRAIERVGIYIPGGSAPLFSTVLMLAIPAQLAGCKEIILCTPADVSGKINAAILYAAQLTGIRQVFAVGGMQAIAAMALGTASIPKVDKIFGPGNQYVTAAKTFAQSRGIAIDLPAGPSELLVLADQTAVPAFIAADLLSQAEHGPDSQVMLLSDSEEVIDAVSAELERQLATLPRKNIAAKALSHSRAILLPTISDCFAFSNAYAPEHLIIAMDDAERHARDVINAGSVFLGHYSCESAGDYASGTNHTLPTNGFARGYSGVSLDSFIKKITFQHISRQGIEAIGPAIEQMAEAEGLHAHRRAVSIRLDK
jgi:histidinol dehydrogenase